MADAHKNLAISAVATAPSPAASGTSLVVTAGHGTRFPTVPFNATIWPTAAQPDPSNAEIVRVTAIVTDTLTIARAQESTTARTVVVGDQIAASVTVKTLTDVEGSLIEPAVFAVTGTVAVQVGKSRYYVEGNYTIVSARAAVNTAPTGASLIVDVNKNGTTIFTTQTNRPTIVATGFTDLADAIEVSTLALGDYLTVDVDQIGSTVAGADLTVTVRLRAA